MIVINTRCLSNYSLTGVQRYTKEIVNRLPNSFIKLIKPKHYVDGIAAHLWEQVYLPKKIGRDLLWSPSNTGPLLVSNQVLTICDVAPLDHPEWFTKKFSSWYKFFIPKLAKRVKQVITISNYSKFRIMETCGISDLKIAVTYLGVSDSFRPMPNDAIEYTRKKLGIPSPYYIVALGSVEPRKNLCNLLKAWQIIRPKISKDIWLVIAGVKGKSLVFDTVNFDKLPSNVYKTGYVSDSYLPALYSGAMLTTYLSFYEGFGLPPLEAMACGTAVLTSNTTSLPEVIGNSGLMVDPNNPEKISEALLALITNSSYREELGSKGRERAKQFNWDITTKQTLKILQNNIN